MTGCLLGELGEKEGSWEGGGGGGGGGGRRGVAVHDSEPVYIQVYVNMVNLRCSVV